MAFCFLATTTATTLKAGELSASTERSSEDHQLRLIRDITKEYELNKEILPIKNHSQPIKVIFDIAFAQLVELDSKNQIMTSYIWVRQFWSNTRLRWDPSKYGGQTSVNLSPHLIWLPDIVLYNNINSNTIGEMFKFDTKVVLHNTGAIEWYAPTLVKSICKIDITYFPFDKQNCSLVFGSWTYTSEFLSLDIKQKEPDLSKYTPNGQWEMMHAEVKRNVVKYSCCYWPYIDVTYTVHIRRRPLFFVLNLILPCILLATLSVFSFSLPPGSGERIALVITLLLGLTVYMLIFTENIPKTSEVTPLINKFFNVVLFEVAICLLATSITLQFYHYHDPGQDLPKWVKFVIFECLGKMMRMKIRKFTIYDSTEENGRPVQGDADPASSPILPKMNHNKCKLCNIAPLSTYRIALPKDPSSEKLEDIQQMLTDLHKKMTSKTSKRQKKEAWHFAALVLDRFFCYIAGTSFFISLLSFYLMIPST
ncbi:predicted protein [Nematostella vectensis]|uniref:Neuronal acetylcholine receptor subunit alpha-10-like n=1 Tax=Nematostella vectensis TaxID=45351 RepID=A7RR86_NEMVE|nr:predicted protein [Nematostella vectensis]|eukprot:XP_001638187.1 predicted protein [Nematostella vectensis]